MPKTDNLESLDKISSTVSARDKKIWENEASSVCIKKATEEWQNKIKQLEDNSVNLQKENPILEKRLAEISASINIQKNALKTCEQSLLVHKSLEEKLIQERDEMRKKYAKVLQMYEDEYQDYRAIYIRRSKGFKDLREKEIRLKKSKIEGMDLNVKIKNVEQTIQQFQTIQNQILQANILKFAKFYVVYHKNEKIKAQLLEMKNEEKQLMKEHLELVKQVKDKHQAKTVQEKEQRQILNSRPDGNSETKKKDSKKARDLTQDRLKKFLQEDIKPISLTSLDYSSQQPLFSNEHSKVRLLDMKVVRQPSLQKSNFDLQKKMKTIMETARKSVLRSESRQTSPTRSQQSQSENVSLEKKMSQSSQEKPSTLKENIQINPILKQKKEELVQNQLTETIVNAVDENISKFFNNKKKSVTFQNETTLNTSQEDKGETASMNNNEENEKNKSSTGFTFGFNKENVKLVELQSVDIFRKPFSFTNETITRQEKKTGFGTFSSEEHKPDPAPESATTGNMSFTPFTATESTAKTSQESSFDPFETSFNRSNFGQSLNVAEEFEQAPESNTFNFFGSQNKNNLFTMF